MKLEAKNTKTFWKEVLTMKINCYDFAMKFAFAKKIIFVLTTHYNDTDSENIKTVECERYPEYDLRHYDVIMCSAEKKNTFKVYGYREV